MDPAEYRADVAESRDMWQRGTRLLLVLTLAALAAIVMILFRPQLAEERELETKVELLAEEEAVLLEERNRLRDEVSWLESKGPYLESVARSELGLASPDELVVRFEDDPVKD